MKKYQQPKCEQIMLVEDDSLCGVKGSHNDYKPGNWIPQGESGITFGHRDYQTDSWGSNVDNVQGGHDDYSPGTWGE